MGLQSAEGIGAIVSDAATAVTLGACPEDHRSPVVAMDTCWNEVYDVSREDDPLCTVVEGPDNFTQSYCIQCVQSGAYTCDVFGGVMTSGTFWLGSLGLFIIVILLCYK